MHIHVEARRNKSPVAAGPARYSQLDGPYPFCWLDATFLKDRHEHRVVSLAVVITVGVNCDGQREVLGLDVGPSEDEAFWLAFLRSLVARGLNGSSWSAVTATRV
jgi:transposase-like protein